MSFENFLDETKECFQRGESLINEEDYDGAIACFEQALTLQVEKFGDKHESVATCYAQLGMCYLVTGSFDKALDAFTKCTNISIDTYEYMSENVANCYYLLGSTNMELKDYKEASVDFGHVVLISTQLFGADAEATANAKVLYNKAMTLDESLDVDELDAIDAMSDAKSCFEAGTKYFDTGVIYLAIKCFEKAVDIKSRETNSLDDDIVEYYRALAIAYTEIDMRESSLKTLNTLLSIALDLYGELNENVYGTYNMLAYNYLLDNDYDKSIDYLNKTITISIKLFGDKSPEVVRDYTLLSHVYEMKGDIDRAIATQTIIESLLLATQDEQNLVPLTRCYNELAKLYHDKHDYEKSLEYTKQELHMSMHAYGELSKQVLAVYENLAYLYNCLKDETHLNETLDKMGRLNKALALKNGEDIDTDTDTEA